MSDEGVSALFTGLGPVLIAKGLQLGLHGVKHRMIFVHRAFWQPLNLNRIGRLFGLSGGAADFGGFGNPPCFAVACPYHQKGLQVSAMNVGEVYLESLSTGIITQQEIDWITTQQAAFNREEEAMALRIGRLLDEGTLQIGCRLFEQPSMRVGPLPPLG